MMTKVKTQKEVAMYKLQQDFYSKDYLMKSTATLGKNAMNAIYSTICNTSISNSTKDKQGYYIPFNHPKVDSFLEKAESITNSISGSGANPMIALLAKSLDMVRKQTTWTQDYKDNQPLSMTDYVTIVQKPELKFADIAYYVKEADEYDVSLSSINEGMMNNGGQIRQIYADSNDLSIQYVSVPITMYLGEFRWNMIQQESSKLLGIDEKARKLSAMYEKFMRNQYISTFTGFNSLKDNKGLFNITAGLTGQLGGTNANKLSFTKHIHKMNDTELANFATGLKRFRRNAITTNYGGEPMRDPVLVVPSDVFDVISTEQRPIIAAGGSADRNMVVQTVVQYIQSTTGYTVLPSKLAIKDDIFNTESSEYIYLIYDKAEVVKHNIMDFGPYVPGEFTANGVDYAMVMMHQATPVYLMNSNKFARFTTADSF